MSFTGVSRKTLEYFQKRFKNLNAPLYPNTYPNETRSCGGIMNLDFQNDNVLIEPLLMPEREGHIIVPDVAREYPLSGRVAMVGNGKRRTGVTVPMAVEVGQTVVYTRFIKQVIELDIGDGLKTYHLTDEGAILGYTDLAPEHIKTKYGWDLPPGEKPK